MVRQKIYDQNLLYKFGKIKLQD